MLKGKKFDAFTLSGKILNMSRERQDWRLILLMHITHILISTMHLHLSAVMVLLCLEQITFGAISGLLVPSGVFLLKNS